MIRYALCCADGHAFESWFQTSSAYDSQRKRKLVTCPVCDSASVEKAIMAPRLSGKSGSRPAVETSDAPVPVTPSAPNEMVPLMSSQEKELRAKLKELRNHIVSQADHVGDKFTNEARKMHYGDIAHRPIYGEASPEQTRALLEEGIEVMPIPVLPEDRN